MENGMEPSNYCPVCGDPTILSDNNESKNILNETNTTLFVNSQEYRTVFQCFIKLFEISEPPWLEKCFVFCSECKRQLTVVSELEQVLKEVKRRLKESEKVVKEKFKGSESKFECRGVYKKDKRYWKLREQFLNRERLLASLEKQPPHFGGATTTFAPKVVEDASFSQSNFEVGLTESIKVEVEPFIPVENGVDALSSFESNPSSSHSITTFSENGIHTSPPGLTKRRRVPPKRFRPDEFEQTNITPQNELKSGQYDLENSSEIIETKADPPQNSGTRNIVLVIGSGSTAVEQIVKVEEVDEYFDEGDGDQVTEEIYQNQHHEQGQLCGFVVSNENSEQFQFEGVQNEEQLVEFEMGNGNSEHQNQNEEHQQDKVIEAATKWMTPGRPEVTHFGIRLIKIGDGKQYQCTHCGKVIPSTRGNVLRNHVVQNHTDLYKCSVCGERFRDSKSLKLHNNSAHCDAQSNATPENQLSNLSAQEIPCNSHQEQVQHEFLEQPRHRKQKLVPLDLEDENVSVKCENEMII
ncbi:unnamed protein product [Orchesella dallaii]|uniref:C2H2-type domain-containing protein n=1 Tax=Orchesella dallaii TaxID=48710 RepID=A0ABP1R6I8_9HEXA